MPQTIVLGAGPCGLATAMMLARDGHRVTVLERDPAPVPDDPAGAWDRWERAGVAQFRQAHFLQGRSRLVLSAQLSDVLAALEEAGALRLNPLARLPEAVSDREPRPGDERLVTTTARRPVLEQVFARAAEEQPGLEVRRGVTVGALETRRAGGRLQVTGVRDGGGRLLPADLIVDVMGRRSVLPALLADAGGDPVHEEAEDSGFLYYTRFFRSADGRLPADARARAQPHRVVLGAHAPRRQRPLVGHALRRRGRPAAEEAARRGVLDRAPARLPAACPLARRRAGDAGDADGRRGGPLPPLQRDGRRGQRRRRLGLHQSFSGPGDLARAPARVAAAGRRARALRRSRRPRRRLRRGDGARADTVVPGDGRLRPRAAGADRRDPRRRRAAGRRARRHRRAAPRGAARRDGTRPRRLPRGPRDLELPGAAAGGLRPPGHGAARARGRRRRRRAAARADRARVLELVA